MKRRVRYLIGVALVVAIAAITVPAAQAAQQPERPGLADFGLRQDPLYGYPVDGTASPAQVQSSSRSGQVSLTSVSDRTRCTDIASTERRHPRRSRSSARATSIGLTPVSARRPRSASCSSSAGSAQLSCWHATIAESSVALDPDCRPGKARAGPTGPLFASHAVDVRQPACVLSRCAYGSSGRRSPGARVYEKSKSSSEGQTLSNSVQRSPPSASARRLPTLLPQPAAQQKCAGMAHRREGRHSNPALGAPAAKRGPWVRFP